MILGIIDTIKDWFVETYNKISDFILQMDQRTLYTCIIVGALVLVLIIVLLTICIKSSKKKRLAKKAALEASNSEELTEENTLETVESANGEAQKEKVETEEVKAEETEELAVSENVEETVQEDSVSEIVETETVQEVKAEEIEELAEENAEEIKQEDESETDQEEVETEDVSEETKVEDKRKVLGKYEVYKDSDFYKYTLKASNGEILIESEVYTSLEGAKKAIETVRNNVAEGIITINKDKYNQYQFKLSAKNYRTLVISANYPTEKGALRASESFKRFAIDAVVVELDPSEVISKITPITVGKYEDKDGGKIVIEKEGKDYFFRLYASNNELMCSSQEYKTYKGAENGIETLKSAIKDGKFYLVKDKRNLSQFKLYTSNNRLVCVGQAYRTKTQAKQSATIVCSYVAKAVIESNQ